jgi:hypothetical protein
LTFARACGYGMHRLKCAILFRAIEVMNELEAFHRFLGDQLANGDAALTPEECVDLWRAQNPAYDELYSDVQAVKEALDDMEAGDHGIPLQDFLSEVRGKKRCL